MMHKTNRGISKFHDTIFQEMEEGERLACKSATHQFVEIAAKSGYSIDDLLEMLHMGVPVPYFARLVIYGC